MSELRHWYLQRALVDSGALDLDPEELCPPTCPTCGQGPVLSPERGGPWCSRACAERDWAEQEEARW